MSIDALRNKIHELVDKIEDESTLNILMEDAALYTSEKNSAVDDELTAEQWSSIEKAQQQIKDGNFKTFAEVKEHFAQWLTK
jgi:hypothetical protein